MSGAGLTKEDLAREAGTVQRPELSVEHSLALAHWERDGVAVLRGFFDAEALNHMDSEVAAILDQRTTRGGEITIDVLEGPLIGQRLLLREAPDDALEAVHKVNDLYLESDACRNLNLNPQLRLLLKWLLKDDPLVINSLTFTKGSQQPSHFDTYFMPPPVEGQMVVASICLEDQSPQSGPVSYFPGSHKIAPYVFSHGGFHSIPDEMDAATTHIENHINRLGLEEETFVGKAGDVLLWHAQLYHGGTTIDHHDLTRKTLVTHYWRRQDVEESRVATAPGGGHYLVREHQDT